MVRDPLLDDPISEELRSLAERLDDYAQKLAALVEELRSAIQAYENQD